MKISIAEPEFQPVTIVLGNKLEVRAMRELFEYMVEGNIADIADSLGYRERVEELSVFARQGRAYFKTLCQQHPEIYGG